MYRFTRLFGGLLFLAVAVSPVASAAVFVNSLWLGNDTNASLGILNTDRLGNVLQTLPGSGVGFGVDVNNNILYVNDTFTSAQPYDITTLLPAGAPVLFPGGIVSEDLSFDGTNLLVGDFGNSNVLRITTAGVLVSSVPVGFQPLGLTWDGGTGFWATPFLVGGAATHFDALGNILSSFVPFPDNFAGGMGYDTTDGTLWIGTFGSVSHFTTGGTFLGSFTVADGRFIDGLEFEGGSAVPEPGTLALLAAGLALVGAGRRRKQ